MRDPSHTFAANDNGRNASASLNCSAPDTYLYNAFEQRLQKASVEMKPGDILTLPRGGAVVVVRVLACGIRRGPAAEARALYEIVDNSALDRGAAQS
ncbi:MAG TPA: hypothetical protein VGT78_05695 [Rhizomicrobium sp.]|nr:hypothetical protein [Rhizomicrobium sp.]